MDREAFREQLRALAANERLKRAAAEPEIARKEAALAAAEARLAAAKALNADLSAELARRQDSSDAEPPANEDVADRPDKPLS